MPPKLVERTANFLHILPVNTQLVTNETMSAPHPV